MPDKPRLGALASLTRLAKSNKGSISTAAGGRKGMKYVYGAIVVVGLIAAVAILALLFPGVRDALRLQARVLVQRREALASQLIEHLKLVGSAIGMAVVVGVSVGILLTRLRRLAGPALGAASVIQTIPSLALLALMIPIFGIGVQAAIAALFLYALLPMLRNTYTAIDEVDPAIIAVGRGMGMTNWQILTRVEIPLCVPVVMAGIRTSTVIGVGIATLATFASAGGLGDTIMIGMTQAGARANAVILAGVAVASALALSLDGLAALTQKLLTPRGLKLASSSR
jgi:osmoprotectant transport system permease protein